jgi:recombination protein RecT
MASELAEQVAAAEAESSARAQSGGPTLRELIRKMEPQFRNALPAHVDSGRFVRMCLTAVSPQRGSRLLECEPTSVLAAMTQAAQLGLEIDAVRGQAYVVPRWNSQSKTYEAVFQLGYRGLIDLAGRAGIIVSAADVHATDHFSFEKGLVPQLTHRWQMGADRGPVIGYYAIAALPDGRREFELLSVTEAAEFRDRFAAAKSKQGSIVGPWADHFDAMARKTAIRRLLNYLPVSVELLDAMQADDAAPGAVITAPLDLQLPAGEESTA